jgi:purine-binding chemotaxis protein CheW
LGEASAGDAVSALERPSSAVRMGTQGTPVQLVVFAAAGLRFALPLAAAERVLRMVSVAPLPGAPGAVAGVVSVHGCPVPVLDIRRRLDLPLREYGVSDHLFIARARGRRLAIPVDEVLGVSEMDDASVTSAGSVFPGLGVVSGIACLPDGIVLIHDLEAFLSVDEERTLGEALEAHK